MELSTKLQASLKSYLSDKKILFMDPNKTSRNGLKITIIKLGAVIGNCLYADTFEDAKKIIKEQKPEIVFSVFSIDGETCLETFEEHHTIFANRSNVIFAVTASESLQIIKPILEETEIDSYLAAPFTNMDLETFTKKLFKFKLEPTNFQKQMYYILELFYQQDYENAQLTLDLHMQVADDPSVAHTLMGKIKEKLNDDEGAYVEFKEALQHDSTSYHAMFGAVRTLTKLKRFAEAYEEINMLAAFHPKAITVIPDLIKLSLANKKYEDLISAINLYLQNENLPAKYKRFISAGLALAGKKLMEDGKIESGTTALLQAIEHNENNLDLVVSTVRCLIQYKDLTNAEEVLEKTKARYEGEAIFKSLGLEIVALTERPGKILEKGYILLNSGFYTEEIYDIMIKTAVAANKPKAEVIKLLRYAVTKYPNEEMRYRFLLGAQFGDDLD